MIFVHCIERWHETVRQGMDMALTERALGIERQNGVGHGIAVQYTGDEPRLRFVGNNLPVKRLVDDKVCDAADGKTGSADILAAGTRENETSGNAKPLIAEFVAFVYALLQGLSPADVCELFVNGAETPRRIDKASRFRRCGNGGSGGRAARRSSWCR